MNLKRYDGKRIALVMDVQGREVILCGTITIRRDAGQGQMLQVTIDQDEYFSSGSPVFLISEDRWRDQITSGILHDCTYMLDLSEAAVAAG